MGFIIILMMGLACAIAAIAFVRLSIFYRKKDLRKEVIVYGILLSICLHAIIFFSYVRGKDYWVFAPIFTQINYLFLKPFIFSIWIIPLECEKLNKLSKIVLSSIICGVVFSFFILPPYIALLCFIASIIMVFFKEKNAKYLNKIILTSIVSSLILCGILMMFYDDLLSALGAKFHY